MFQQDVHPKGTIPNLFSPGVRSLPSRILSPREVMQEAGTEFKEPKNST